MATPMTPTQLKTALAAEKVALVQYAGWETFSRDKATGKPFGPVHGVVMHHTAGHDDLKLVHDGRSDLPGPLAHAYIDKQGRVYLLSPGRANHAGGGDRDVYNAVVAESYATKPPAPKAHDGSANAVDGNDCFYGFECENLGDGKDPWPSAQYTAMVKSAAAICRHYGWSAKSVIGHLEWSDWKSDPKGFTMTKFRGDVAACLALPAGAWPMKITTNAPPEDDMPTVKEIVDGIFTADRIPASRVLPNSDAKTNPTWTFQYAVQTAVESARSAQKSADEANAKLDALTALVQQLVAKGN